MIREARERQRRRRRRLVVLLLVVAGAGGVAYGIDRGVSGTERAAACTGSGCAAAAGHDPGSGKSGALYGLTPEYAGPKSLSRISPKTLASVGKKLEVSEDANAGALSPDGTRLLMIRESPKGNGGPAPSLSIVDLAGMRFDSAIQPRLDHDLAGNQVVATAWPTAGRVLVVAQRLGTTVPHTFVRRELVSQDILAIDPVTGAVEWKRSLSPSLTPAGSGMVGSTFVLLLRSNQQPSGRATVMAVAPNGSMRSSTVALTAGGYESQHMTVTRVGGKLHVRSTPAGRGFESQLVITSDSSPHAYVLTGGGTVYSIDPQTAEATAHVVPAPAGAPETSPQVMLLDAAPLGHNLVVSSFFPRPNGTTRAGIYLIDPATWTARLLDPTTPSWVTAGASLITFTDSGGFRLASSWLTKGTGVRIYDSNGDLRHHLFGNRAFEGIERTPLFAAVVLHTPPSNATQPHTPAQQRTYDASIANQLFLFDPSTGKTLGERTTHGDEFTQLISKKLERGVR